MLRPVAGAILFASVACSPYSHTTRVVDGREVEGRPIHEEAYAAYLAGATLEASQRPRAARDAYAEALSYDPSSPEIQTALARVVCRYAHSAADEEFERALEIDPHYEPAHRERARCALARGKLSLALSAAYAALASAPLEFVATEVLVDVLLRAGEAETAERHLTAFLVLQPDSAAARAKLEEHHASMLKEGANEALAFPRDDSPTPTEQAAHAELERAIRRALREGDDALATDLMLTARLGRVALGRLALEEGRPDFALQQSHLVLFADPKNSDARILSLVSAQYLQDGRAYRAGLLDRATLFELPSQRAAEALARLIEIKAGRRAASSFSEAYQRASEANEDPARTPPPPHSRMREAPFDAIPQMPTAD